jgi:hypothetical protein
VNAPLDLEYAATGYTLEGYTYQASLSSTAGAFVTYPEAIELVAELRLLDRIAGAAVAAWVERPDGTYTDLVLKDDGVAPDVTANDGLYSGLLYYDEPGDHTVTVLFDNINGQATFTRAGMADVLTPFAEPVGDDFDRFATLQILVDEFEADDHGATEAEATDLLADNSDMPGRIDRAGDVDRFRATSPAALTGDPKLTGQVAASGSQAATRYALRLTNLAFGMDAVVRVTTSGGTKEYTTGVLAYDAFWSVPVDLAPGETVAVEVRHKNGQSAVGQYDISFGKPLTGDQAGGSVYLPQVSR